MFDSTVVLLELTHGHGAARGIMRMRNPSLLIEYSNNNRWQVHILVDLLTTYCPFCS